MIKKTVHPSISVYEQSNKFRLWKPVVFIIIFTILDPVIREFSSIMTVAFQRELEIAYACAATEKKNWKDQKKYKDIT